MAIEETKYVIHELKAPLNAISVLTSNLIDSKRSDICEEDKSSLSLILELVKLIDYMISPSDNTAKTTLNSTLSFVFKMCSPLARKAGITILTSRSNLLDMEQFSISQSKSDAVYHTVVNLIQNSIKYSGSYNVTQIFITYNKKDHIISIYDNGNGISQIDRNKLFVFGERLGKSKEEGNGWGLAISKMIMKKAGGDLTIRADTAQTIFDISLSSSEIIV
jgi:signal transduction histidine kinase